MNHKGRVASTEYSILHSLDVCDCIDLEKSQVKWNPLDKAKILSCNSLILKPEAMPPQLSLFRLKHWGSNIMASEALVKKLQEKGFIGFRFIEPSGFTGIG
jgi:hypothetical protein